ncbi:hypothetical protein Tco_1128689 [Tanacetum coccineum]
MAIVRTPHITAYCLALILMALTFFAFAGSFATRRESTFAVKFCTPICSAIRKPAIKASYSASLLDASNSTLNAHEDPSIKRVHGSGTSSSAVVYVDGSSSSGRSVMKSAKIWPQMDVRGLYLISNTPSSKVHFSILPAFSGRAKICLIG